MKPPPWFAELRYPYAEILKDHGINEIQLIKVDDERETTYAPAGVDKAVWTFLHDSHLPDRPPLREYVKQFFEPPKPH